MSVKCQVVMNALEEIAPRHLAESWDNVGLMVGSPAQEVRKILVCLDASEAVVDRAARDGFDLIVAHHPLIFKPLKQLRTDLPQGRVLAKLVKRDIAVFAAHTNLDTADGGVNDVLAALLSLDRVEPLTSTHQEPMVKLVVFVPRSHAEAVRMAIGEAGAGFIGKYSHCSFEVAGTGNFLPGESARPFIGKAGTMETVEEIRLETILPDKITRRVLKAMRAAHPYEEVAYDLYPLRNAGKSTGLGRIGALREALTLDDFGKSVKAALRGGDIRVVRSGERLIRKVALCGGSGAEFIAKAAYAGADVLVTGDVKYHEAQKAVELGIHVVDAGHFGTEFPMVRALAAKLEAVAAAAKWNVEVRADQESADLFAAL